VEGCVIDGNEAWDAADNLRVWRGGGGFGRGGGGGEGGGGGGGGGVGDVGWRVDEGTRVARLSCAESAFAYVPPPMPAPQVLNLKLLVCEALSCSCVRPYARSVCGLELLRFEYAPRSMPAP
jgi:hypothetical protein